MSKFIIVISGVSIAVFIGLSNVTLADETEAAEEVDTVAVEEDETDEELRTRAKGVKKPGDEDGDDIPKGSGDPMKGLLGGKGTPCKPCDVPFGGTVNTGEDADTESIEATSKEKNREKAKKKDGDG